MARWKHATPEAARAAWEAQRNDWARRHRAAIKELRRRHLAEYDHLMDLAKRGDLS